MDIFNKKLLKEKEEINEAQRRRINDKNNEINDLKKQRDYLEKQNTKMIEENQKLISWIMNILNEFGTMEVRDRRGVSIPVYISKRKNVTAYDSQYLGIFEKERITIPEITIIKMG